MPRHLTLIILILCGVQRAGAETAVDLAERFATADDRETVVAGLVPGTGDWYHYRCLLWQHQGRLAQVDEALPLWEASHGDAADIERIRLRQALLWFDRDPAVGGPLLTRALHLDLSVPRPAGPAGQPAAPAALDQSLFAWAGLKARAVADDAKLEAWSEAGLERLLPEIDGPALRRAVLAKLKRPVAAGLVDQVVADLKAPGGAFGSLEIHHHLTLAQLDACRAALPAVMSESSFVTAYLSGLMRRHRGADAMDAKDRRAYHDELEAFAATLPATGAPLRAWLGLQRLRLDLDEGRVDAVQLARLLHDGLPAGAMPRGGLAGKNLETGAVNPDHLRAIHLDGSGPSDGLVQEALEEVLAAAPDTSAFDGVVEAAWLRQRFVAAKLLHGVGDPAHWLADAADAATGAELAERVELRFARSFPTRLAGDAAVELPLVLKHVPRLLVRVYAFDPLSCARQLGHEPDLGVDVTGMAPTAERTIDFAQSPIIRHAERLALPECAAPGWWLVELVGGGQHARAFLAKGGLRFRSDERPDGEHLVISDEADRPVRDASAWIGDQLFTAGDDGSVRLPFALEERSAVLAITGAGHSWIGGHPLLVERWRLDAGALLDREQLIAGGQATLLLRPRLYLRDTPVPFSHLAAARVEIETVTHDGAHQRTEVDHPGNAADGVLAIGFPVPEGAEQVTISMRGTVRNQAAGRDEELSDHATVELNLEHWTDRIDDLQLERDPEGWTIACLGRNGEPLPGRRLQLAAQHRLRSAQLGFEVVTGADGRARLGRLDGVTALEWTRAAPPMLGRDDESLKRALKVRRRWTLTPERVLPAAMTVAAGAEIRLPAVWRETVAGERDWWLMRGDVDGASDDLSDGARLVDEHGVPLLLIAPLTAGDYLLTTPVGDLSLAVVDGTRQGEVVMSPSAIVRVDRSAQLGVRVVAEGAGAAVQVVDATPGVRVQIIGHRFHPPGIRWFSGDPASAVSTPTSWTSSSCRQGMPLDEETRYILERAQAAKLPGVMLERPGLVLNPWHDETFTAIGAGGGSSGLYGSRNGGGKRKATGSSGGSACGEGSGEAASILDFLDGPAVVLVDRRPDAQGALHLTAAELGDARELQVIACDGRQRAVALCALAPRPLMTRDRRLRSGLPPGEHLVYQRTSQPLAAGAAVDLGGAALDHQRLVSTVGDLLRTLAALAPDAGLDEFAALGQWHLLGAAERRAFYERHACHEVNLFLWRKDPAFFAEVVRPHLANKLQKTFLDQWLLDEDLGRWLAPDRHARLNTLERILLARRIGGAAGAQALKNLDEEFATLSDESAELSAATVTALLDQGGHGTSRVMKDEMKRELTRDLDNQPGALEPGIEVYRDVVPSRTLIEQNWFEVPWAAQDAALIRSNGFWRDYARWDGKSAFLSTGCLLAHRNRSEALAALALVDLPFAAAPATSAGNRLVVSSPALLFREQALPAVPLAGDLIVHQRLYLLQGLAHGPVDLLTPLFGPLETGTGYLCRSVVVNPTPRAVTVAILAQIPTGAVPLMGAVATVGREEVVGPYASLVVDQACYFPTPYVANQFPTHCCSGGTVVSAAASASRDVRIASSDGAAWSERAGVDRVLAHLDAVVRDRFDVGPVRWRLGDADLWRGVIAIMERRQIFDPQVWSFAVLHHDAQRLGQWLRSDPDLLAKLGNAFWSHGLVIDPFADGGVIHADIDPVINARAHRLPGSATIVDPLVAAAWEQTVERVCLQPELDDRARLELAYGLMLQDRCAEAAKQFAHIDRARLGASMPYDYLGAYLAFARGDLAAAEGFATPWKDYPVERWRLRFGEVLAQLAEIAGHPASREQALAESGRQSLQAVAAPSIEARLVDGAVAINAANVHACAVRFHRLDLEPLFSSAPFGFSASARPILVAPTQELAVTVAADGTARAVIPEALRGRPLAIEVAGGGRSEQLTSFAGALEVRVASGSGQLVVLEAAGGKPLPATYVKVYAERADGGVSFHKDGYTDLRGRFDYASLGTGAALHVKRFALFISNERVGSTVREVAAP